MTRHQSLGAGAEDLTLTVDGVPIHFVRSGAGPAVVLIHGASGNLRDMTFRLAPALARRHTVVAFDRPGHGASGWPDRGGETLGVQAALMRKALAAIGIARATVIGHSYGGAVALAWALDAPETVTGLGLLGAPTQAWTGGLGLTNGLLAHPLTGPLLAYSLPALVTPGFAARTADGVFAPQDAPAGYLEHLGLGLVLNPESLRANAVQLSALKSQIRAMLPRYGELGLPIEVLHGDRDPTVPIDQHAVPFAAQVARARLTRLEGVGHMPHQVALPAVEAALARLSRRAARS